MQLLTGPALDLNMCPALTDPTGEAHRHDSYRAKRRRHTNEIRVREELRRARRPSVIHRPRSTLPASRGPAGR
jgi:hypothetical protein